MKPFLKWAGSKQRIAPKLNAIYDNHRDRRLVEPFCGGLGVALGLMPDRALLNDVNSDLIGFYQTIQFSENFKAASIPNTEQDYYLTRDRFNQSKDVEQIYWRSQDFYYLNLAGFNGLCRYNQQGDFNVPYGKRKKLSICEDFERYHKAFKSWDFCKGNYNYLKIDSDDFILVDPPYDSADGKGFTSYSGNTFGWQQQIELADWLDRQPKIPQIGCNAATDRIIQLYTDRGWNIEICDMHTSISCNGDRTPRKEVFATRYI